MISYCKNGKSAQVLACPQEKLNEILDSPEVAVACQKLTTVDHDSDEAKTLKQANYTDGRRHAKSAVPTNMAYLDLDELNGEDPREVWKRLVQKLVSLELEHLIVLVHVSCSGKGLRIVYIIPSQFDHLSPTERIDQSKQWLAAQLGVIDDSKTRDLARGSFAVPRSYVLYGPDKRLFEESVSESVKQEIIAADYRTNRTDSAAISTEEKVLKSCSPLPKNYPKDYHGIPFSVIIKKYWEVNNRGFEPTEGDRDTLTYQLACDLRHICGRSFEWLDQVIPCYDGFSLEEKRAKIKSALASEFNGFPQRLRNTLNLFAADFRTDRTGFAADDCSDPQPPNLGDLKKMPQGIREGSSVDDASGDGHLSLYRYAGYWRDARCARAEEGAESDLVYRR